jgi:hypothetical protein
MRSRCLFYRLQHVTGTSFDATPASGTVAFNNTNDFIPVFPPAVHAAQNPQQTHNSKTNTYCFHFFN